MCLSSETFLCQLQSHLLLGHVLLGKHLCTFKSASENQIFCYRNLLLSSWKQWALFSCPLKNAIGAAHSLTSRGQHGLWVPKCTKLHFQQPLQSFWPRSPEKHRNEFAPYRRHWYLLINYIYNGHDCSLNFLTLLRSWLTTIQHNLGIEKQLLSTIFN